MMIEATIKAGRLLMDEEKLEIRYTGIVGAINNYIFHPIFSLFFNMDKVIPIKDIDRVTYRYGVAYVTKPAMIVYYKGKKRIIAFKPLGQILDYEGAKKELVSVIGHLRQLGVTVEESSEIAVAWR